MRTSNTCRDEDQRLEGPAELPVKQTPDPEFRGARRGRLCFYHPNSKGAGSAARFELKVGEERPGGCFFLEMATQKSAASHGAEGRVPASFAWDRKITVKLDFGDICELLAVLDGLRDAAGSGGKGIYHESKGLNTIISFRRSEEAKGAYLLGLSRRSAAGEQVFKGHIVLRDMEALGLKYVLRSSLFHLAFAPASAAAHCAGG